MYQIMKEFLASCNATAKKVAIGIIIAIGIISLLAPFLVVGHVFVTYASTSSKAEHIEAKHAEIQEAMAAPQNEYTDVSCCAYFLNVGAADCTVISGGDANLIIDLGDTAAGELIAKEIKRAGMTNVSVMLTNTSEKRVGGFAAFIAEVRIKELIISANADADMDEIISMAKSTNIPVRYVSAGDQLSVGNATVEVLSSKQNLITRISAGKISFLLTSDASLEEEIALYDGDTEIRSTVLKIPNNGAVASDINFIRAVGPQYVIVSSETDEYNRAFLNEIRKIATVFRTDKFGTIIAVVNGDNCKIGAEITMNFKG